MGKTSVADETNDPKPAEKGAAPRGGVLIELDRLIRDRRRTLKEILEKRMTAPAGQTIGRLFFRVGLCGAPAQVALAMARACGAAGKAVEAAMKDLAASAAGDSVAAAEGAAEALKKVPGQTVLITWMEEPDARRLLDRLGLDRPGVRIHSAPPGQDAFPDPETWLAALRAAGGTPSRFLAVADNEAACRAALFAGLRCVAAPDDFTAGQDYAGASGVAERLNELPGLLSGLFD